MTSEPCPASPLSDNSSGLNIALTLASLCTARLLIIRSITVPPVILSIFGAIVSAMVLTAFAPMASLQSTRMWTMTIGPESVSIILA